MERDEILTKKDLLEHEERVLKKLDEIASSPDFSKKKWLRSADVCQMLSISASTLQGYRISGVMSYSKIAGLLYYDYNDVVRLMEDNRRNTHSGKR